MRKFLKILMVLLMAIGGTFTCQTQSAWASGKTATHLDDVERAYDNIVNLERQGFAAGTSIAEVRSSPAYREAAETFNSYSQSLGAEGRRQFEQARNVGINNVNNAMRQGQAVTGVQALQGVAIQGVARSNMEDDFRHDDLAGTQQEMAQMIRLIATVTVSIATGVGIAQQAPSPMSR